MVVLMFVAVLSTTSRRRTEVALLPIFPLQTLLILPSRVAGRIKIKKNCLVPVGLYGYTVVAALFFEYVAQNVKQSRLLRFIIWARTSPQPPNLLIRCFIL
jgi:hypothetical protein